MTIDRRNFMKATGLAVVGLAGAAPVRLLGDSLATVAPSAGLTSVEKPLVGQRWAMVVDLRKCLAEEGCTKCVEACHVAHNVPKFPTRKDEIKWIWKEKFEHAFAEVEHEHLNEEIRHAILPVLCNHCDNPPCVRVCPTQATWRRESDGIVMMDWHRCIGCRYCVAACPYGSRSFNWRDPRPFIDKVDPTFPTRTRGVVEKCTFCEERLAKGKLPACVEACGSGAMIFGDLEDPESNVRQLLGERFSMRRKASLGTQPEVYYIL